MEEGSEIDGDEKTLPVMIDEIHEIDSMEADDEEKYDNEDDD